MISPVEEIYFLVEQTYQYYYEISHQCSIFDLLNQTWCYYNIAHRALLILLSSWVLIKMSVEIGFLELLICLD